MSARDRYRRPTCCRRAATGAVGWHGADASMGPERDGWAVNANEGCYDPAFDLVHFCPYCGAGLDPGGGPALPPPSRSPRDTRTASRGVEAAFAFAEAGRRDADKP